ncbi:sulfate adenylyltransferase [bacterium]|jgi:sulfate adenylyltransferase|nr:sulfate adenylyltransferase [bacterium]
MFAPHGGLKDLVDRMVPSAEQADFVRAAAEFPKLPVSDADLSTLYRFGDGGLSPLQGPMTKEVFDRVLDEEVVLVDGVKYAWTIPLSFPASYEVADALKIGQQAALVNSAGELVGTIAVEDVFPFEKARYLTSVYSTSRLDHPGARMVLEDGRHRLVGGQVRVLPQKKHPAYGSLVLSPKESREYLAKKGWDRVVAFQTRNPLHRAHEYAMIYGLEKLVREGHTAGAVLHPLVGETKSDDVDAPTRMQTYIRLMENGAFGEGDIDSDLWASKKVAFKDRIALLALDIKMFYAGPKEAIMHAIYRQNFGFTDIIIGRKHADAPYDDGKDIWDGLQAQRKFDNLPGKLEIQPVKVGFAAFFEELGRVGLVDEYGPKGYKQVAISGRDLRKKLQSGELPDPRIMRRETAEVLIAAMSGK